MLFVRPKISEMGMHLFSRSVHPELYEKCSSRLIERERYCLSIQITMTGHLISFQNGRGNLTEICSGIHQPLPTSGRLISHTIDSQHKQQVTLPNVGSWESRYQIDVVDAKLFVTVQQHLAQQKEFEGLLHRFAASGRMPLGAISYVNVQAYRNYLNVMSFHTFPDTCSVVRAETKFSLPA